MKITIARNATERAAWHRGEQPSAAEERKPPKRSYALSDAPIERMDWPETRHFERINGIAQTAGSYCTWPRYREIPHFDHRCGFCNAIYPRELAINVWGCESCEEIAEMRRAGR